MIRTVWLNDAVAVLALRSMSNSITRARLSTKAEFPPTTSDMAYIEDGVVHDVETWNN